MPDFNEMMGNNPPATNSPEEQPPAKELSGLAAVYAEDDPEKQKKQCLKEIDKILKKHDGMESNIGLKDEYWDLTALYRQLNQNP